jgi:DNA polymerase delta subunit 1
MPGTIAKPQKRVLADSTKAHRNVNPTLPSPKSAKRRKLDGGLSPSKLKPKPYGVKDKLGSSQPKSQFEEEVLEKLTQDVNGLKQKNSEKDQQWTRPPLDDFDETKDNLCFQQIDVEEGTLHGGRTALKLFGVTEVQHGLL